jgi:hypothetical protein
MVRVLVRGKILRHLPNDAVAATRQFRRNEADSQVGGNRSLSVGQRSKLKFHPVCQTLAGGRLAKSVHDAAWSSFFDKLAESAGRIREQVDPRGASQHGLCGAHVPKTLIGSD